MLTSTTEEKRMPPLKNLEEELSFLSNVTRPKSLRLSEEENTGPNEGFHKLSGTAFRTSIPAIAIPNLPSTPPE